MATRLTTLFGWGRKSRQRHRRWRNWSPLRIEALEERCLLAGDGPQVVDVLLSGQTWDPEIPPHSLIADPNPGDPLPWIQVDQIQVRFDRDVEVTSDSPMHYHLSEPKPEPRTH